MIKKLIGAGVLVLVGAGLMYYALSHHIVKTRKGTVVVPKRSLDVSDTYVNVIEWKAKDFADHPVLTRALIEHGHQDVVVGAAADSALDWIKDKAGEAIGGALEKKDE